MSETRLDLAAIEASLLAVQRNFDHINVTLDTPRDPLSDRVLANLMAGYIHLDELLAAGLDPLALGNSRTLLRLNYLVLCGDQDPVTGDYGAHAAQTEARFYDDSNPGGVRALVEFLATQQGKSVWQRAAAAYTHILSAPQLFIEGNHRTGALIMSGILCRGGQPPFVLTVGNAKAYFDPSSLVKACRKHSIGALFKVPKLRKRLAALLAVEADARFLRQHSVSPRRNRSSH